ncbi:hypothetical protein FRC00_006034 [Tulasnella sp. 408]|nr:hypothetical protein FRC00_006034 [Tulasnella sp. 408]
MKRYAAFQLNEGDLVVVELALKNWSALGETAEHGCYDLKGVLLLRKGTAADEVGVGNATAGPIRNALWLVSAAVTSTGGCLLKAQRDYHSHVAIGPTSLPPLQVVMETTIGPPLWREREFVLGPRAITEPTLKPPTMTKFRLSRRARRVTRNNVTTGNPRSQSFAPLTNEVADSVCPQSKRGNQQCELFKAEYDITGTMETKLNEELAKYNIQKIVQGDLGVSGTRHEELTNKTQVKSVI